MDKIKKYVDRACDPFLDQPDLALNMEICDIINQKEKSYPSDAARAIVKKIGGRNTHVSLLALTLLDHCVKNCGYPFHLQISSREFLNALVKNFPDFPPAVMTPVMYRILELIQEWQCTICQDPQHTSDLRMITDMYQLLLSKGYCFPGVSESATAVLGASKQFKSPEELEKEDRKAKSAKLQDLIRRGTPAALAEANELMKVMAGYDIEKRPDYNKQAEAELDKISKKAAQLFDFVKNAQPGENLERNPTVKELVAVCESNQPKLQKLIGKDDGENMERLLSVNDQINQALGAYLENKRRGWFPGQGEQVDSQEQRRTAAGPPGAGKSPAGSPQKTETPSLIDLDFFGGPPSAPAVQLGGYGQQAQVGFVSSTPFLASNQHAPPDAASSQGFGTSSQLSGTSAQGSSASYKASSTPDTLQVGNRPASGVGRPGFGPAVAQTNANASLGPARGGNLMNDLSGLSFSQDQPSQPAHWGGGGGIAQAPQWGGTGSGQSTQPALWGANGSTQLNLANAPGGVPTFNLGGQGNFTVQPNMGTPTSAAIGVSQYTANQGMNMAVDQRFGSPRVPMATGFGSPQPGFGAPQPGFGSPQPGFGSPQPGFGSPHLGFGSPQPGFGQAVGGASHVVRQNQAFGQQTPPRFQ